MRAPFLVSFLASDSNSIQERAMVLIFTCHSAPCTSPRHFSLARLIRCRIAPISLSASGALLRIMRTRIGAHRQPGGGAVQHALRDQQGPERGPMMNLADQKESSELVLKTGPNDRIVTNVVRTRSRRFGSIRTTQWHVGVRVVRKELWRKVGDDGVT